MPFSVSEADTGWRTSSSQFGSVTMAISSELFPKADATIRLLMFFWNQIKQCWYKLKTLGQSKLRPDPDNFILNYDWISVLPNNAQKEYFDFLWNHNLKLRKYQKNTRFGLKYHFIFSIPDAFSSYQIVEIWYSKIPVGNAVVSNTSYYLRPIYTWVRFRIKACLHVQFWSAISQ